MHTRQRGDACQFRAPADDHGAPKEPRARAVPISVRSAGGVDVQTDPDLVSIPHPGGVEREKSGWRSRCGGKTLNFGKPTNVLCGAKTIRLEESRVGRE